MTAPEPFIVELGDPPGPGYSLVVECEVNVFPVIREVKPIRFIGRAEWRRMQVVGRYLWGARRYGRALHRAHGGGKRRRPWAVTRFAR